MTIDSEAQKDLELDRAEAEQVNGGHETVKKSSHRAKHRAAVHIAASAAPVMIVQPAVSGTPIATANSGDDDCAPESGGDPGNQDGLS